MGNNHNGYRGCLLGMGIGDAMGYAVDLASWEEIRDDYGPEGLRGYDLVNGYADISSHTQLAMFAANGLLMGMTRGQSRGKMAPFVRYAGLAMEEWARGQHQRREPERCGCWVSRVPELRRRRCMDTRMLDTLTRGELGTPEEAKNRFQTPGSLASAACAGLFFHPDRMAAHEVGTLGLELVALTHGDPMSFLSGGVLAFIIAGILQEPQAPLRDHCLQAADAVAAQFSRDYPQAEALRGQIHWAVMLAQNGNRPAQETMEHLKCESCGEVLAGAVFACLRGRDFDECMILAVNHSGKSGAVGAVAGAIAGAYLGESGLPAFYLESLEERQVLTEMADDLAQGCPQGGRGILFDDTWDQKYVQGRRVEQSGWAEEE